MSVEQKNIFMKPISVSSINPVYDAKGCITEWGVTVTFQGLNIKPPHARGARVSAKNVEKNTSAEYLFAESVMKQGLERVWSFREAMLRQIARQNEER